MIRHTVENALYEGARTGIVPGATTAAVEANARSALRRIGISGATIDVLPAVIDNSTREVSVRIRLPLEVKDGAARVVKVEVMAKEKGQ